ncbi:MAG: hypothetical protein ABIC18_02230, partial [Candidatus Omnitrophota bacterium]
NENQIIRDYPSGTEKILANDVTALAFSLNGNFLDIQFTCAKIVQRRNLSLSLRGHAGLRN